MGTSCSNVHVREYELKNEYVLELNVMVTRRHIQHPGPVT